MKYVCIKKCFYRKRLWSLGETLVPEKGEEVPKHFKKAKNVKVEVELPEKEEVKTFKELQAKDEKDAKKFLKDKQSEEDAKVNFAKDAKLKEAVGHKEDESFLK